MSKADIFEAAGFCFPTKAAADEALEEEKKIYYIRSRLSKSSGREKLLIYNKMVKGNVLKTPVGLAFLKEMYDLLSKDPNIEPQEVECIPFGASYGDAPDIKAKKDAGDAGEELEKCRGRLRACGIAIAALIICILAMFSITMKSENPNILNYEIALQNKYASWEQELSEREKKVREKEQEVESWNR